MKKLITHVYTSVVITNVTFWAFILLMSVLVTGCGEREIIPAYKQRFFVKEKQLCDSKQMLCFEDRDQMVKLTSISAHRVSFIWKKKFQKNREEVVHDSLTVETANNWAQNVDN